MTPGTLNHLEHLKTWFFSLDKPLVRVFASHQKVTAKTTTLMQFPSPDDQYDERDIEKSWQMLANHLSMISDGQYTIYVYDEFTKKEVGGIKFIKGQVNQNSHNNYGMAIGAYSDLASKNIAISGHPQYVGSLPGYISEAQASLMTNNALMSKELSDIREMYVNQPVETLFDKAVALCETLGVKEAIQQFIQLKVATAMSSPVVTGTPNSKKEYESKSSIVQQDKNDENDKDDEPEDYYENQLTDTQYKDLDKAVGSISKIFDQHPVDLMNKLSEFLEKNPDKVNMFKQIINSQK